MKIKLTILLIMLLSFNLYSQGEGKIDVNSDHSKNVLRSYLNAGVGRVSNYVNVGAGLFFPFAENILIGTRANANFEVGIFKTPAENNWDIDIEIRYIPFITNRFIISTGIGIGYSHATQRGEQIINNNFLVNEYEKVGSSSIAGIAEVDVGIRITDGFGISLSGYTLITNRKPITRYQIGLFLCKVLKITN